MKKLKPRIATLEQTFGLLTFEQHKKNFRLLINDIYTAGYNVRWKIEDLSNFGLPQKRKRLLIIAARYTDQILHTQSHTNILQLW